MRRIDGRSDQAMKTVGVLGGLGPQATMDFETRLHDVSKSLIRPRFSGGYPPMLVYYYRHPPFVLSANFTPVLPLQPDPRLLQAAARLGEWADFLVMTANVPHLFQDVIEQAFGGPLLSIIEVTLAEVERRGLKRVGVLGWDEPKVYVDALERRGLSAITLPKKERAQLNQAIFALMEGRDGTKSQRVTREAVDALRAQTVDGIILGCTELPLLLRDNSNTSDLINPAQLLAEATVQYAIA